MVGFIRNLRFSHKFCLISVIGLLMHMPRVTEGLGQIRARGEDKVRIEAQAKERVHSVHAFKRKEITNRPVLRLA